MQVFWWLLSLVVAIVVAWLLIEEFVSNKDKKEIGATQEGGEPAPDIEALAPRPEVTGGSTAPAVTGTAVAEIGGEAAGDGAAVAAVAAAAADEETAAESEEDKSAEVEETLPEAGEPVAESAAEEIGEAASTRMDEEADVASKPDAAAVAVAAEGTYPDNLTLVKGVGKVYQQRLYEHGIFTWHQVTQTDVDKLREICDAIDAANVHDWPRQASLLAAKHDREGAAYAGPAPDDLTRIDGIGQVGLQRLYKAGIMTFGQLAAASPEILAAALGSGGEPATGDFDAMIAQASALGAG